MQLTKDLVPIIRKEDMDRQASEFLAAYCPQALQEPMPIPLEDMVEKELGLDFDYVNITEDSSILGMTIFSDGAVELYNQETGDYFKEEMPRGTILIESSLCGDGNRGRERFTIAHEIMHWDKHQLRFTALAYQDKTMAKACRCPKEKVKTAKTPEEWLEWQADNLAAAVLMPKEMFTIKVQELAKKHRYKETLVHAYLPPRENIAEAYEGVVNDLALFFQVSKESVRIRLQTLGLLQ